MKLAELRKHLRPPEPTKAEVDNFGNVQFFDELGRLCEPIDPKHPPLPAKMLPLKKCSKCHKTMDIYRTGSVCNACLVRMP